VTHLELSTITNNNNKSIRVEVEEEEGGGEWALTEGVIALREA